MRVAVVGGGIAGLVAARLVHEEHELTLFEAGASVGGHSHAVDVETTTGVRALDTGFLVYNREGYPEFTRLLEELGVETQASDMSFSVRCERSGLEYNGSSLNALFAQRSNILRPSFYRMLSDIVRFYREAPRLVDVELPGPTLGEYLDANDYSQEFIDQHLLPMGAAIWSAPEEGMRSFPAKSFVRFFQQHGLMQLRDRPRWRTIRGSSRSYVRKLTEPFRDRIRTGSPVGRIERFGDRVDVQTAAGGTESFDQVVLALHSDQALRLLADPSEAERSVLSAIPYQENDVVLHRDERLLPRRRLAHAAWNYHLVDRESERAAVTYYLNRLMNLEAPEPYLVTLNRGEAIAEDRIIQRFTYHHPVYSPAAFSAQARHGEVSGVNRTHYCGAYWGYGFHEDGVKSAQRVVQNIREQVAV